MKIHNFKLFFQYILAGVVLISGCTKEVIHINILKPAEVIIPQEIEKISILPIAGLPEPCGIFKGITHFPLDTNIDYNLAKMGYVDGLYNAFTESPRFRRVVISDSAYRDSLINGIMDFNHVKEICRTDSTDALLLIKSVQVSDNFDMDYIDQGQYRVIANLKVGIYEPGLPRGGLSFRFDDVLYYYSYKRILPQKAFKLLSEMFYYSGINLGKGLVPHWQDGEARILLKGLNTDMKMAASMASRGNWDEATKIWNALSAKGGKRLEAKAAFNIAVAWEQADDLEQAWIWIDYSDSLLNKKAIDDYKSVLEQRIKTSSKIDVQMPVY